MNITKNIRHLKLISKEVYINNNGFSSKFGLKYPWHTQKKSNKRRIRES